MKMFSTDLVPYMLLVMVKSVDAGSSDTIRCYSCTYNFAGTGIQGYSRCITNPVNISYIECPASRACKTIAVFDKGRTIISSVSRTCIAPSGICTGEFCCNEEGIYTSQCEQTCTTQFCNNYNPENWLSTLENIPVAATTPRRQETQSLDNNGETGNGSGDDADNSGSGSADDTGEGTSNPADLILIHEDLFHVDINAGNQYTCSIYKLLSVLCTMMCLKCLLF